MRVARKVKLRLIKLRPGIVDSMRWWCPSCNVERTGDRLDRPCCCLKQRRAA